MAGHCGKLAAQSSAMARDKGWTDGFNRLKLGCELIISMMALIVIFPFEPPGV